jgi:APA family basic amino acid/polyamine antiporter
MRRRSIRTAGPGSVGTAPPRFAPAEAWGVHPVFALARHSTSVPDPSNPTTASTEPSASPGPALLARRLGLADAVLVGLGAMLGAGVFIAFAPAAAAAGSWLLVAVAIAAVVAALNATSTARLAARDPRAGGVYTYGTARLGPFWGYVAGSSFVIGKVASCAAMALVLADYLVEGVAVRVVAVASIVAVVALDYRGVQRTARTNRVLVALTVVALVSVVLTVAASDADWQLARPSAPSPAPRDVLQGAALLFFAFAGYARLATLGEEVTEPRRTIPRAVAIALLVVVSIYAVVGAAVLVALSPEQLAASTAPVLDAAQAVGAADGVQLLVRAGAVAAAAGALIALVLGVSRTVLAMARDGWLPTSLAAVHPVYRTPHHAELAVGVVLVLLVTLVDVREAIAFSSFGVLLYYSVAHASSWTLQGRVRWLAIPGLVGCVALIAALPAPALLAGGALLAALIAAYPLLRSRV